MRPISMALAVVLALVGCGKDEEDARPKAVQEDEAAEAAQRNANEAKQLAEDAHAQIRKLETELVEISKQMEAAIAKLKNAANDTDRKSVQAAIDKLRADRTALVQRIASASKLLRRRVHDTANPLAP